MRMFEVWWANIRCWWYLSDCWVIDEMKFRVSTPTHEYIAAIHKDKWDVSRFPYTINCIPTKVFLDKEWK